MVYLKDIPGRTTEMDGHAYLFFSGFAYLGMPSLPEFQETVKEGISKYGAVFPSSRVSNTRQRIFHQFEEALSEFIGYQKTACFSSGYLAAMAAVRLLSQKGEVFSLKSVHPSLQDEKQIKLESTDAIVEQINTSDKNCSIILESVYPLTGQLADFSWLLKIKKPVRVLIDDSHGIGVLGKNGEGVKHVLPQSDHLRYLICYSLSKAFSCEGGAVSGSEVDIRQIKSQPPFSAATPMSPAMVYAWMNSRTLFKKQLMTLKENIHYFKNKTASLANVDFDGRLPVCFLAQESLYENALKHHILLSAFSYPTEASPLKTRAVINALHTKEDLNCLFHLFVKIFCRTS